MLEMLVKDRQRELLREAKAERRARRAVSSRRPTGGGWSGRRTAAGPCRSSRSHRIANLLASYGFDRIHGAWTDRVLQTDGNAAVQRSAERHLAHTTTKSASPSGRGSGRGLG
jgi:hypothetical protein